MASAEALMGYQSDLKINISKSSQPVAIHAAPVAEWVMRPPGSALAWGPRVRGFETHRGQHYFRSQLLSS
ncbi:hypothetical protein I7I48_11912 [Histoplasma ohiense]|nr:hypothetical protein I7I48_11912 [Histoplasma ohiense (nom. inval.)]